MKKDIHPTLNHVIFVDATTGDEIRTRSVLSSPQRRSVGDQEFHVLPVDISSYSHPFYTGTQRIMDTEGRVDRFRRRYNKR